MAAGSRHFDKNVWWLPIPKFDADNDLYQPFVSLAEQSEKGAAQVEVTEPGFQKFRGLVRAELESAGLRDQMDVMVRELFGEADLCNYDKGAGQPPMIMLLPFMSWGKRGS